MCDCPPKLNPDLDRIREMEKFDWIGFLVTMGLFNLFMWYLMYGQYS